jgi:hypothetical protein
MRYSVKYQLEEYRKKVVDLLMENTRVWDTYHYILYDKFVITDYEVIMGTIPSKFYEVADMYAVDDYVELWKEYNKRLLIDHFIQKNVHLLNRKIS